MQGTDPERQSVHPAGEATFPEPLLGAPGISRSWQHGPQRGDRPEVPAISPLSSSRAACEASGVSPVAAPRLRHRSAPHQDHATRSKPRRARRVRGVGQRHREEAADQLDRQQLQEGARRRLTRRGGREEAVDPSRLRGGEHRHGRGPVLSEIIRAQRRQPVRLPQSNGGVGDEGSRDDCRASSRLTAGAPGRIRTRDPQIRRKMVVSDRRFERIYDFRETSGETQAQDRFRGHRIKRGGGGQEGRIAPQV